MIFSLVYASVATAEIDFSGLRAILSAARPHNEANGITGMLLYHRQRFMQVLEGPEPAVLALFHRIRNDLRHKNVVLLDESRSRERCFPGWTMAFRFIPEEEELPEGLDFFLQNPNSKPGIAHPAMKFLLKFRGSQTTL